MPSISASHHRRGVPAVWLSSWTSSGPIWAGPCLSCAGGPRVGSSTPLLLQPRIQLAFWATGSPVSSGSVFPPSVPPSTSFSRGLLLIYSLPSLYSWLRLHQPRCRPCTWSCWTSRGSHRHTCQSPSGWHPFPSACWLTTQLSVVH